VVPSQNKFTKYYHEPWFQQTNKQQAASLLSHGQTAMTTYSEAVCHAGQHREKVYTLLINIAPCQDTHKALRHGSHSFTCKLRHACLLFRKRCQMAPLLSDVEGIWWGLLLIYRPRRDERLS